MFTDRFDSFFSDRKETKGKRLTLTLLIGKGKRVAMKLQTVSAKFFDQKMGNRLAISDPFKEKLLSNT